MTGRRCRIQPDIWTGRLGLDANRAPLQLTRAAEASHELLVPPKPQFLTSSADPIALRDRLEPGRTFDIHIEAKFLEEAVVAGGSRFAGESSEVDVVGEVRGVSRDGNSVVVLKVMHAAVHGIRPGDPSFDSRHDADAREACLVPLATMVDHPLTVTVSPTGGLLGVEARSLVEAVRQRGGESALGHLPAAVDLVVKNVFVVLPKAMVKAGDAYDANTCVTKLPDGGILRQDTMMRLGALSADKRMALLEWQPRTPYRESGSTRPQVALERVELGGWLLFDLEKGNIARSFRKVAWSGTVSQGEKSATIKRVAHTNYVRVQ